VDAESPRFGMRKRRHAASEAPVLPFPAEVFVDGAETLACRGVGTSVVAAGRVLAMGFRSECSGCELGEETDVPQLRDSGVYRFGATVSATPVTVARASVCARARADCRGLRSLRASCSNAGRSPGNGGGV
jgi:hypothetical protein